MAVKRIGIVTGGGDAPGLNAVIRAVVKTAAIEHGAQIIGIADGFDGLFVPGGTRPLTLDDVRGILPRGGTILGTANRGNPFAQKVTAPDGTTKVVDRSDQFLRELESLALDALIIVGGDGTLRIALELQRKGCRVVGVPKTIDNDVGGTEITFGFDTALNTATEALDKLHTTAESHHRAMVVELMGRDAGFLTLNAGVSGGADVILIPEIPFLYESVCRKVTERASRGSKFSILAVSEGAHPRGEGSGLLQGRRRGVRPAAGRHRRRRRAGCRRALPDRSARHRPGARPARRRPHPVRPLAGDALRRGRGPGRDARRVRPDGGAAQFDDHRSAAGRGAGRAQTGGPGRRGRDDGARIGDLLRRLS